MSLSEHFLTQINTINMRAFLNERMGLKRRACREGVNHAPILTSFICTLLLLYAGSMRGQATTTWVDSQEHYFTTSPASGTLYEGEGFDLQIQIGEATDPFNDLVGIDFWVTVDGATPLDTPPTLQTGTSWLLSGSDSLWSHWSGDTLYVRGIRQDSTGQSGSGTVISIPMEVTDDELNLSNLQMDGGGMVLVDNVDMKRKPEKTETLFSRIDLWPNPVHEQAHIRRPRQLNVAYHLLNDRGQMVWQSERPAPEELTLDTGDLPAGMYYLIAVHEQGTSTMTKVLVR